MISTALRTGNSLPQITPCPLLDRFMLYHHGLNVIRQEEGDDVGPDELRSRCGDVVNIAISKDKLVLARRFQEVLTSRPSADPQLLAAASCHVLRNPLCRLR